MHAFAASTLEFEKFLIVNSPAISILPELSAFVTLERKLKEEFASSELVYERVYPEALSAAKKSSLILTQLVPISQAQAQSNEDPLPELSSYYTPKDEKDETLIFESRFESGNLCLAFKVSQYLTE